MKKETAKNAFETFTLVVFITLALALVLTLVDGMYNSCQAGTAGDTRTQLKEAAKLYTYTEDSMEKVFKLQDFVATLTDHDITRMSTVVTSAMRGSDPGTPAFNFFLTLAKVLLDEQLSRF